MEFTGKPGTYTSDTDPDAAQRGAVLNDRFAALLEIGRQMTVMGALYAQAERHKAASDYQRASEAYEKYVTAAREHLALLLEYNRAYPDSPYEIEPTVQTFVNVLMVYADVLDALGQARMAEPRRDEAFDLSRQFLGVKGDAEAKRARAASLISQGRFNEAMKNLMEARDIVAMANDHLALARITIDLADILQWLGDFARADEEVVRAERLLRPYMENGRPTTKDVFAGLLSSVSSIMKGQGDPGDAVRAANLYRAATEVVYYRGLIARARGDWDLAEKCFIEVLPDYRNLSAGEAIEWQLAQVQLGRGEYVDALERLRKIEPTFETGAFRPKRGVLRRAQAECLSRLGDGEAAAAKIRESLADLTGAHLDPDALWRSQWLDGQLRSATGDLGGALERYREAIDTVSSLRRAPLGYRLDSKYLEDKVPLYSEAIRTAVAAGAAEDGCRFIESIKSRTLTAVLSFEAAGRDSDSPVAEEFEEVTRSLDALEYQYYRDGWTRETWKNHQDLLKKRADLLERIRITDPRWHLLSEPTRLDLDRLKENLSRRSQAAISLYYDPPHLTAVLVTGSRCTIDSLEILAETDSKLNDFARNLQKDSYDPFKHDLSAYFSITADELIPPALLEEALEHESLVVVPHGILHLVPWAGLIREGKRLFETASVTITPNLHLVASDASSSVPRQLAIVAVQSYHDLEKLKPLETVGKEVVDVVTIYTQRGITVVDQLLDQNAVEEDFWKLLDRTKPGDNMLHMSCHGVIVPAEPMNSGLLLADSKVDAAELARARLPFSDVVLSACSTGWRPSEVNDVTLRADEVLGIPAGFLEGRVDSVVVSIPKAESGAARSFVRQYHAGRAAGDPPRIAFRHAQQFMLESGVEPGNWLGFTLYGFL